MSELSKESRIATLPKWAQREIYRLQADVASLTERLTAGPENSDTFADAYSDASRPLGKGTSVAFKFGPGWGKRFVVRLEGERLIVHGGSSVAVHPRASNLFEVSIRA